jgi:two-component system sensor histidine kinase HydH
MKARRFGPQGWWAPIAAAVLACAVLMTAAVLIYRGVRDASLLVARGMGEALELAGRESLGGPHYPPDDAALRAFVDAQAPDGLRYAALVGDDGQVTAHAGEPQGTQTEDGLQLLEGRARLVGRLRQQLAAAPTTDGRRRLARVVYEFEPVAALELQRRSRDLLFIAAACGAGILALAVGLSRALRQRERLSEELEHGKRLAALGAMSAVLAHELRNPLTSLKGHAQLLAESVEKDERLSPGAGRVVFEAVRLERLMNDLLAFVKSGELHREAVDPAQVLRAAVESCGAALRVEVASPGAMGVADFDAARLQQALENILRNALQASPEGAKVHTAIACAGGRVVYTVRDHGPGIAPGEETRIFEPFVTGRVKGIGLGLAITRRIVELHGGTVTARTLPEGGAEFTLDLPAKEP